MIEWYRQTNTLIQTDNDIKKYVYYYLNFMFYMIIFMEKKMWKVLIDSKNNKTILLHTFYHSNIVGHWDRSKGLGIVFIDDW